MKLFCAVILFCFCSSTKAQSYHAIKGSAFGGVTSMYDNPASTINCYYNWDVSLLSSQFTLSNQAFVIRNASTSSLSYLSPAYKKAHFNVLEGDRSRDLNGNADANLLNFRVKLNRKSAFAFGLRGRTFGSVHTDPFKYNYNVTTLHEFLGLNYGRKFDGRLVNAGWMELNFNYSRVIDEDDHSRLTAGATLSILKGLTANIASLNNITYSQAINPANNKQYYYLSGGVVDFKYSTTNDVYDSTLDIRTNIKNIINAAKPSASINAGIEYIIKSDYDYVYTSYNYDWRVNEYEWKFGASIMDLGANFFSYGVKSSRKSIPNGLLNDTILKTYTINNLEKLRDTTLHTFNEGNDYSGNFDVATPARLVMYADRNFGNNCFVNAELSLNFYGGKRLSHPKTTGLNLLVVTPRWETKAWGIYFPMQLNYQMQFWAGAALKMGPLLIGVHDINWYKFFSTHNQTLNGGAYILLSIHPFPRKHVEECPSY